MVGEVGGNAVSNVLTSGIAVNLNLTVFDVSISIPTVFGETKSFQCDFAVSCLALIIAFKCRGQSIPSQRGLYITPMSSKPLFSFRGLLNSQLKAAFHLMINQDGAK